MQINYVFLIVLAILLVFAIYGGYKGFILSLFGLIAVAASVLLAGNFSHYVSDWMCQNEKIYAFVDEKVGEGLSLKILDADVSTDYINSLGLPGAFAEMLTENCEELFESLNTDLQEAIMAIRGETVAIIMQMIAFVITFIVAYIVLLILFRLLNGIANSFRLTANVNSIMGFILGLAKGLVLISVLGVVVSLLGDTTWGGTVVSMIRENGILTYLYDHNIITFVLTRLK